MIPVKDISTRCEWKNLRFFYDRTLPERAITTAIDSQCFDEIYIYTASGLFNKIARDLGVEVCVEPEELITATNDVFALDFMYRIECECDYVVQINTTAPFLTPQHVDSFVHKLINEKYDTLLSVKQEQIEAIYAGIPLNFQRDLQMKPSQELDPVLIYTAAIMGWNASTFKANMERYGAAVHGLFGKTGYWVHEGLSTIDIDTDEDFKFAEQLAKGLDL